MIRQWKKKLTMLILTALGTSTVPFMGQAVDLTANDAIRMKWDQADDQIITDQAVKKTDADGNLVYDFGTGTVNLNVAADYQRDAALGDPSITGVTATVNAGTLNLTNTSKGHDRLAYNNDSGITVSNGTNLTINSNVNLKVAGTGSLTAGIISEKLNWRESENYNDQKTTLTVNGDVHIGQSAGDWGVVSDTQNGGHNNNTLAYPSYTGSRWSPAGVLLGRSQGSSFNFNGNFEAHVYGNGVVADAHVYGTDDPYKNEINIMVRIQAVPLL